MIITFIDHRGWKNLNRNSSLWSCLAGEDVFKVLRRLLTSNVMVVVNEGVAKVIFQISGS
jgi:hypothetical protein